MDWLTPALRAAGFSGGRVFRNRLTSAFGLALFLAATASADFSYEIRMKRSVEGKPGVKERCTKFMVARDRMKIQERDTAAIFDLRKELVYSLTEADKTYHVIPFATLRALAGKLGPAFAGESAAKPEPKATGEKKKIAGIEGEKYLIASADLKGEIWVATRSAANREYNDFHERLQGLSGPDPLCRVCGIAPGFLLAGRLSEKLLGEWVHEESEITSMSKEDVPASAIDVPAGYTLEEFPLSM